MHHSAMAMDQIAAHAQSPTPIAFVDRVGKLKGPRNRLRVAEIRPLPDGAEALHDAGPDPDAGIHDPNGNESLGVTLALMPANGDAPHAAAVLADVLAHL
jgi:hypothetical protein